VIEAKDLLKELGWSEELIQAFTVDREFPRIESRVTYEPHMSITETSNLVITGEVSQ
jgi:hypothetical protein